MYAIVDIETTGGYAAAHGITEVAIVLHDGKEVVQRFETLINPGAPIPVYIQALTGINEEMVRDAPAFEEAAPEIFDLLKDNIFVAHNVNFDYSFLKHHLSLAGYDLQCKRLCTVRLGRKIFPGLSSYSLSKFCGHMNIIAENRHRAGGDAEAAAKLFSLMLRHDTGGHIENALKRNSGEQVLPPNLPKTQLEELPSGPGVYYFTDKAGKTIYVGKARNLKKRVFSHFSGNSSGRRRQEFLRNIYGVTYQSCGTELMAFILEAVEIQRLWPAYNRAMKRFEQSYGLYAFEDQQGYLRMAVDKRKKHSAPLCSFPRFLDGHNFLMALMQEFGLCPKLCFIQKNHDSCTGIPAGHCQGACEGQEPASTYNKRVHRAIERLSVLLPSFAVLDEGRSAGEQSCILVEKGKLYGMGYLAGDAEIRDINSLKPQLQAYPSNAYILNLVHQYAFRYPERKINFSNLKMHFQIDLLVLFVKN